jgi:hypothetical protein
MCKMYVLHISFPKGSLCPGCANNKHQNTLIICKMSALDSGKTKLGTIISFENLPKDRNDSLWTEIRTDCGLTLDELSALKNAVCPQGNIPFSIDIPPLPFPLL